MSIASPPVQSQPRRGSERKLGFPNPYERALFMAANRTRSDPSTVKGSDSKIYPPAAPLALAYDLERSSRFHATMPSKGHAPLMHPSPCTLAADVGTSGCDGTPSCGCQGGATCNTCDPSACPAGTDPGTRIGKFYSSANWGWGEIIAAGYGDPWSTMDAWVDEPASSDGHRQIVTSASYGVVGFGHASDAGACYRGFDAGDFGGDKPAPGKIASAAPKPIAGPAGTFRIYATWADAQGGAPSALRAVVDGSCVDMQKELGDPKLNATYYADVPLANGCHDVFVLGSDASGARAAYPTTTAFTINVGNAASCPDSVRATALAAPGHAITRVVANWTRFGYTSTYPLTQSGGAWTLSLAVTQRAGTHTISVTATDDVGNATTSPSVSISVQ